MEREDAVGRDLFTSLGTVKEARSSVFEVLDAVDDFQRSCLSLSNEYRKLASGMPDFIEGFDTGPSENFDPSESISRLIASNDALEKLIEARENFHRAHAELEEKQFRVLAHLRAIHFELLVPVDAQRSNAAVKAAAFKAGVEEQVAREAVLSYLGHRESILARDVLRNELGDDEWQIASLALVKGLSHRAIAETVGDNYSRVRKIITSDLVSGLHLLRQVLTIKANAAEIGLRLAWFPMFPDYSRLFTLTEPVNDDWFFMQIVPMSYKFPTMQPDQNYLTALPEKKGDPILQISPYGDRLLQKFRLLRKIRRTGSTAGTSNGESVSIVELEPFLMPPITPRVGQLLALYWADDQISFHRVTGFEDCREIEEDPFPDCRTFPEWADAWVQRNNFEEQEQLVNNFASSRDLSRAMGIQ